MKHKHYDCIVAWAEGKQIQNFNNNTGEWEDLHQAPFWINKFQYRIKPELKADPIRYASVELIGNLHHVNFSMGLNHLPNLKLTFDAESRELKSAEVI
jgi:hypothetical protein